MPKRTNKEERDVRLLWQSIESGRFGSLDERVYAETELKGLASHIKEASAFGSILHIIEALPKFGTTYDWNVGGLLRHFEADLTISAVQHAAGRRELYESAGLAWAFGQFRNRHRFIVDHLYAVVRQAQNGEAWWQAAFSLENLGEDNAVNLLKRTLQSEVMQDMQFYLRNLEDKRSLIALLVLSNASSAAVIYPFIVKALAKKNASSLLLSNTLWLAGRLRIFDEGIVEKAVSLTGSKNHDVQHYAFFALQNFPSEKVRTYFEKCLSSKDRLARKFAARGLRVIGSQSSLDALDRALEAETDPTVIFEISKSVYRLKNPLNAERLRIRQMSYRHENGALSAGDIDPGLFNRFMEAQDPEGMCFALIRNAVRSRKIKNPIDITARTGRLLRQMFDGLQYDGTLYGIEPEAMMSSYADRKMRRERNFRKPVELFCGDISGFAKKKRIKSSLIVSAFSFRTQDITARIAELKRVHELLADDGEFFTVGWDEMYNDAALSMWYKYIPDGIAARDFEEWRERRLNAAATSTADGLTWYKRGLHAPLQFRTMDESANVVGHLFGRDAAQYAIRNRRTEWSMSLGITRDTKKSLAAAIESLEEKLEM